MAVDWLVNLATFSGSRRPKTPLTTISLAKNNFYYEQYSGYVRCKECNWYRKITDVGQHNLTCPNHTTPVKEYSSTPLLNSLTSEPSDSIASDSQDVYGSFSQNGTREQYRFTSGANNIFQPSTTLSASAANNPQPFPTDSEPDYGKPMTDLNVGQVQMKKLANRIYSFYNWPDSSPVTGKDLAEAGFYFIGPKDRVKCAYCHRRVKGWVDGDDPIKEHQRLSPFCDYIANL